VIPVDAATIKRMRAQLAGDADLAGHALARRLAQQADSWFESLAGDMPAGWALAATGGYSRGVLCPGSDIDVMLLHPQRAAHQQVQAIAESLWYPMWDAGLKLGPSVHTPKSAAALAADDLDTATTLLGIRCLAGDGAVVQALRQSAVEQWRRKPYGWLQRLQVSANDRWARRGDVASLLEPDLKEGRGGLRDHDMIRWALLVDRPEVVVALETPFDDLAGAADLLLAARCELHRATGRTSNTLQLQDQDHVAAAMGYADADALMDNISSAAHAIEWATERFWRRVERLIRSGGRPSSKAALVLETGVVVVDGEVQIAADADVDDQSYVLRLAAAAAHAGRPLSGRSLRALASRGAPPGEKWTERTYRAFVSLLGSGAWVVPTVEALERYDLFSRYLPEWRAVRSKPQRNAFHTFTVDRHLLQTVANANAFVRDVARPDLLLVGALLHDIGKGYPGDHTEAGVNRVADIGERMGLTAADLAIVRALIEHHLLLPETATRRDLSDPRTAANVAAAVGDQLRLDLLRALTEADSLATGPAAWSGWKASLIAELVQVTSTALRGGAVVADVAPVSQWADELAALVRAHDGVHMQHVDDGEFHLLRIASRDRAGLFAHIAGVLTLHGLDVVGASAITGGDGTAVDEFRIWASAGITPGWAKIEHDLRAALGGELDIDGRMEQRLRNQVRSRGRAMAAAAPRLEVLVSNDASDSTTVIDVRAPDGPAVLYRLSHALTELGVDIRSAKVATLGHEVVDVFYVQTRHVPSRKLPDNEFGRVRDALRATLTS
jgi:[protein-PII] uridylyltransferase